MFWKREMLPSFELSLSFTAINQHYKRDWIIEKSYGFLNKSAAHGTQIGAIFVVFITMLEISPIMLCYAND